MQPLSHICTVLEKKLTQVWVNRGCVTLATAVGPIFQDITFIIYCRHINTSIGRVKVSDELMSYAMSQLTHLSEWLFLHHFNLILPHKICGSYSPFHQSAGGSCITCNTESAHTRVFWHGLPEIHNDLKPMAQVLHLATHTPIHLWHCKTHPFTSDLFQSCTHWNYFSRRGGREGINKIYFEQYLQSIGQTYSYMGFNDPSTTSWESLDFY